MATFGTLWVGRPLSKIEWLCLSSFVKNGHEITLFVYDEKMDVPKGVKKKNANEIVSEQELFLVKNSYGPFADLFRYQMIQKTGLIWTDTDNICIRENWDLPEYAVGEQEDSCSTPSVLFEKMCANGIVKAPANSAFIAELIAESMNFDKRKIKWAEIGPQLVSKTIYKYGLQKYIQPIDAFYAIPWWEWKRFWDKQETDFVLHKTKNSYCIQVWNQMINLNHYVTPSWRTRILQRLGLRETPPNYDKNNLPAGSVLDYYYEKYVRGGGKKGMFSRRVFNFIAYLFRYIFPKAHGKICLH